MLTRKKPLRSHRKPTAIDKAYVRAVREARKAEGKENTFHWQSHHIQRPHKSRLLWFVLIPRELHDYITDHPAWARANGWNTNVNGSLTVERPEVMAALEREKRLLAELENP